MRKPYSPSAEKVFSLILAKDKQEALKKAFDPITDFREDIILDQCDEVGDLLGCQIKILSTQENKTK
jgi:hypothetical protein